MLAASRCTFCASWRLSALSQLPFDPPNAVAPPPPLCPLTHEANCLSAQGDRGGKERVVERRGSLGRKSHACCCSANYKVLPLPRDSASAFLFLSLSLSPLCRVKPDIRRMCVPLSMCVRVCLFAFCRNFYCLLLLAAASTFWRCSPISPVALLHCSLSTFFLYFSFLWLLLSSFLYIL